MLADGPDSGGHVLQEDTGKLRQGASEKAGLHRVQVPLEEPRAGSLDTQKHLLCFVKEPVGRSYEVTGLTSI